jgi:hypothetical protein
VTNVEVIRRDVATLYGCAWRQVRVVPVPPRKGVCYGFACDCAKCSPVWTVTAILPGGSIVYSLVVHRTRSGAIDAAARAMRAPLPEMVP